MVCGSRQYQQSLAWMLHISTLSTVSLNTVFVPEHTRMAVFCGQTPLVQMYLGVSGPCGLSPVGTQLPLPRLPSPGTELHGEGSLGRSWISSV